jgi:hypothetical protein
MRTAPVYIRGRCEQSGLPKEKASRYTVRPGTLGLTLDSKVVVTGCTASSFKNWLFLSAIDEHEDRHVSINLRKNKTARSDIRS